MRGGANGELLLGVVQEQVQCAMEFGFSTLGDTARVNLTFGCGMGDTIRNGIMPHLWDINLSHIYAREVR